MTQKNDPSKPAPYGNNGFRGLTAIEHAALVTGQPCSGTPWLDEMLAKARRERLAGQALAGLLADSTLKGSVKDFANEAMIHADTIIAALEGGAK